MHGDAEAQKSQTMYPQSPSRLIGKTGVLNPGWLASKAHILAALALFVRTLMVTGIESEGGYSEKETGLTGLAVVREWGLSEPEG